MNACHENCRAFMLKNTMMYAIDCFDQRHTLVPAMCRLNFDLCTYLRLELRYDRVIEAGAFRVVILR